MANSSGGPDGPTWEGADYARVLPGRYSAVAVRTQGPEFVFAFRRFSLMVEFELLGEPVRVCAFFNMGNDPKKPQVGRNSNYFKAWTIANGEPPHKRERMHANVFLGGQVFLVEVADCLVNAERAAKPESLVYSRVTRIISAESPNHESFNRESIIMNHPIKQSTNQVGQHAKRTISPRSLGASPSPGEGNANPSKPEERELRFPLRPDTRAHGRFH